MRELESTECQGSPSLRHTENSDPVVSGTGTSDPCEREPPDVSGYSLPDGIMKCNRRTSCKGRLSPEVGSLLRALPPSVEPSPRRSKSTRSESVSSIRVDFGICSPLYLPDMSGMGQVILREFRPSSYFTNDKYGDSKPRPIYYWRFTYRRWSWTQGPYIQIDGRVSRQT